MNGLLVLDASVLVNALVRQPQTDAARALLQGERRMIAPHLAQVEVANALWKLFRNGLVDRHRLRELSAALSDIPVEYVETGDLVPDALALAAAAGHSVYDCLYLALSLAVGAQLVTADRRLFTLANEIVIGGQASWLGDWAP